MNNIATILQTQAEQRSQAPAMIDLRYSQSFSFGELEEATGRAAALLQQAGLQAGDAALIFQPMSAQLYVALLALFRLGVVAMFVDPSAGLQHLDRCCQLSPPQALIASSKAHLLRLRSPSLRQIPVKFAIGLPLPGSHNWARSQLLSPLAAIAPCQQDTPALLTFTSGSTGQPKAALRTHGFLLAQHRALADSLNLTAGEVDLATLPIFVLANLASGVTSLIPDADLRYPGRIHAARLMAQIQQYQPHSIAASPALLSRLVEYGDRHQMPLTSFRKIFSGGAPVFPQLLDRLQRLAPQADVVAVYGSTEAEPIAHIAQRAIQSGDRAQMQTGGGLLVGTPSPALRLQILPDQWGQPLAFQTVAEFAAAALPANAVGEIVVSGDHVLPGYLQGKGDAETKFRVEGTPWHRTGDAGYLDGAGRLWLLGRCSARIEDEQGILYPFAVETAAQAQSGIRRTAFVSHQEQRLLVVELEPHIKRDRHQVQHLVEQLQRSLSWAKLDDVWVCPEIPVDKRHNAKIDYPQLKQVLETRRSASEK